MEQIEDSIEDYKNKHEGERVFIVGNGPSLKHTPLDLIEDEFSMAMNRIDLIYPETDWRPTYYFQMNSASHRKENLESTQNHLDLGIKCFVNEGFRKELPNEYNHIYYLNIKPTDLQLTYNGKMEKLSDYWSTDIQQGVYKYSTSLHSVAQIAHYMGFKKIYLLGCDLYPVHQLDKILPEKLISRGAHPFEFDHDSTQSDLNRYEQYIFNFSLKQENPFSTIINGVWSAIKSTIIDLSIKVNQRYYRMQDPHFTSEYKDKIYRNFKNEKLIDANKIINAASKEYNFNCYNASVGGELEVHERVDFKKLVSQ